MSLHNICGGCGVTYPAGSSHCPVCATVAGFQSAGGDTRPELAIQALLLAVEAMRAQIQAQAVRITILEERFGE